MRKFFENNKENCSPNIENPEKVGDNLPNMADIPESPKKNSIYVTPKNSFSFSRLLSVLASNEEKSGPKITQELITLPDPFSKLILEPSEYSLRYKPSYVVEFSSDIFEYLKKFQFINIPTEKVNADSKSKMKRASIINKLIQIHAKFQLKDETLFITVNILDRYIEKYAPKNDLEFLLIGVSSLFIASKFEEIHPPELQDFVVICKYLYQKKAILSMEKKICLALRYDFLTITPLIFLERLHLVSGNQNEKVFFIAKYLLELTLLESKFYAYPTLMRACSAFYLAMRIKDKSAAWGEVMIEQSGYEEKELKKCAKDMCMMLNNISKSAFSSVVEKYSQKKYMKVAMI